MQSDPTSVTDPPPRKSRGPLRVISLQCSSGLDAIYGIDTDWQHPLHRRVDFLISKMTADEGEEGGRGEGELHGWVEVEVWDGLVLARFGLAVRGFEEIV